MDGYVNKEFYLYKIENKINGKFYVGVTGHIKERWQRHKLVAEKGIEKFPHHFKTIHKAIQKYGSDNFELSILESFLNEDAAYNKEREMIAEFRESGIIIYNEAGGGKGTGSGKNHPNFGKQWTDEQRQKLSVARKGIKPTDEARHNMSLAQRGENHPMYGKHHTQEAKEKISKSGLGRVMSKETKEKLSKANKGKKRTEEQKHNMSEALKGIIPWNVGIPHTEETCNKISKTRKEKNYCGEQMGSSKLTNEQVLEIRKLLLTGMAAHKIGKLFGVGKTCILYIKNGKTWKHIQL